MPGFQHDYNNSTQFLKAAKRGSKTVLPVFLRQGVDLDFNQKDENGIPAMAHILRAYSGSYNGGSSLILSMLEKGANPFMYFKNKDGIATNYLIEACLYKSHTLVEHIVSHKDKTNFDINFTREDGMTAVKACLKSGFEIGLNYIFKNFDAQVDKEFLFQALAHKQWGVFSRAVAQSNMDLSFTNRTGGTILHTLVDNYDFVLAFESVFPKIKNSLDFNSRDNHGNTALYYAAQKGKYQFAYHLIKNGADITLDYSDISGEELEKKVLQQISESNRFSDRAWLPELQKIIEAVKTKKMLQEHIAPIGDVAKKTGFKI